MPIRSIAWTGDWKGGLTLLDQTLLPNELRFVEAKTLELLVEAIVQLRVRGAPAIGIAAAYGVVVAFSETLLEQHRTGNSKRDSSTLNGSANEKVHAVIDLVNFQSKLSRLRHSRPTAVNLGWAIDEQQAVVRAWNADTTVEEAGRSLLERAIEIHTQDKSMCHAIGRYGAELIQDGSGVLTHCNTGGLATSEYGTALSTIFTAYDQGKSIHVYADETRPLLQGSRLTMWELLQHGVPCTLICDSMAAQVMREGKVQVVVVGADRITSRGDAANKIGTYGLSILAKHHGIPFYIAAPYSTFDLSIESGNAIPIEQRSGREITEAFGKRTAPENADAYNPAFDVTPAELITGIITEHGVISPVNEVNVRAMYERSQLPRE